MGNTELYIIDQAIEDLEQDSTFVIDTDEKAEWSIKKIAEERAEAQRIISVCQDAIRRYNDTIKKTQDSLETKTGYLTFQLQQYMSTVKAKESKTQKSYKLPSGTLKVKYLSPEYKRDEEKLLQWMKEQKLNEYIKVTESAQWGELKKVTNIQRDPIVDEESGELIDYTPYYVVDANGAKVDGVEVVEREPAFEVECEHHDK